MHVSADAGDNGALADPKPIGHTAAGGPVLSEAGSLAAELPKPYGQLAWTPASGSFLAYNDAAAGHVALPAATARLTGLLAIGSRCCPFTIVILPTAM